MNKTDLESVIGSAAAGLLVSAALALRSAGMSPAKAVGFATMALLEEELGQEVWKLLGFPKSTMNAWRRGLSEAAELVPEDPPEELQKKVTELMTARLLERKKD